MISTSDITINNEGKDSKDGNQHQRTCYPSATITKILILTLGRKPQPPPP